MIETIKSVLQDISSTNPNLQSEAAREMIARLITAALKSEDDLGLDEYPYSSNWSLIGETKRGWAALQDEQEESKKEEYSDEVYNGHENDLSDKINANSPYNDGWTREHYKDKLSEEIVGNSLGYIFESPDGGETVFRRKVGESERELVTKEDWKQYKRNR